MRDEGCISGLVGENRIEEQLVLIYRGCSDSRGAEGELSIFSKKNPNILTFLLLPF